MPARVRFSILETSGRIHPKVYDRRGRSSERERRSLEEQDVQGPQTFERIAETATTNPWSGKSLLAPAHVRGEVTRLGTLYIMQDERCEA